ncbi:hypothetical protein D1BOALGB6SA_4349 [Olavius sp. associated proteobacterium Delta 1]|nr:hypothetical protein D1BOALGB6SA_4349 [Olavius sp. associated proteobacterium Delta 1]
MNAFVSIAFGLKFFEHSPRSKIIVVDIGLAEASPIDGRAKTLA